MRNFNSINLSLIIVIYTCIALLIWAAQKSHLLIIKLCILPIIAALQNHLQILQHESAHFHFHKNKITNDFISNVFCCVPFFGLIRHYRKFHFLHHKYLLNHKLDPEIPFYEKQGYAISYKDLIGINYFRYVYSFIKYLRLTKLDINRFEFMQIVLVAIFIQSIPLSIIIFYWILPQITFLFFFMKIHGLSEHGKRTNDINTCTFNTQKSYLHKFFISPINSHLHLSHHLKPNLPWYKLS